MSKPMYLTVPVFTIDQLELDVAREAIKDILNPDDYGKAFQMILKNGTLFFENGSLVKPTDYKKVTNKF